MSYDREARAHCKQRYKGNRRCPMCREIVSVQEAVWVPWGESLFVPKGHVRPVLVSNYWPFHVTCPHSYTPEEAWQFIREVLHVI